MESLKAQIVEAKEALKAMEQKANEAAIDAKIEAFNNLPSKLRELKEEFDRNVSDLDKEFGVVDGIFPEGTTFYSETGKMHGHLYNELSREYQRKVYDIKTRANTVWYHTYNSHSGLREAKDRLKSLANKLYEMRWDEEKEHLRKLDEIAQNYSQLENLLL